MYPPPPGSAPGYQNAHHCTPRYTQKVITGRVQSVSLANPWEKSGRNPSGSAPPFFARNAPICAIIELIPPVAFTAYHAIAITMHIFIINRKRSVQNTPESPPSETQKPVKGIRKKIQIISAYPS